MQITSFIAVFYSLASLASSAPTPADKNAGTSLLGGFRVSTTRACPMIYSPSTPTQSISIKYGEACGTCKTLPGVTTTKWRGSNSTEPVYTTFSDLWRHEKCKIVLHQKSDCSDSGSDSGFNCWNPEGGILAYRFDCPYWVDETAKPCIP